MSRAIARRCLALAVVSTGIALQAQSQGSFRFERAVNISAPGPQRLAIDVPLLAGGAPFRVVTLEGGRAVAQGGLSDLRLFDASGAELAYLLLYAPSRQPSWRAGDVLAIVRSEKTSGFEADFHTAATIDAIRVLGITPPFLKRLALEGSGDREHWTLLIPEGTLFDLPDEGLSQTDLIFAPGTYRYVRLTWNDANSGRIGLPASVGARTLPGTAPPPVLTATLPAERTSSEPGRSRYRVKLPAASLPIVAIDLDVPGGHVFRDAAVFESRLSGAEAVPSQLGRATLRRVVRDGVTAGRLRIPIAQPSEAALDVVVDDGANAPLDVRGVTAVFAELPWIYFEPQRGPIVARYGNRSAAAPSYDLEAVRETVQIAALRDAAWGEPRSVEVAGQPTGASAPGQETGAQIEPTTFEYNRTITGADGLCAVTLDAAVLAHSRGPGARFADVRIIDGSKRQVPYLVERRDEPLTIDLAIDPARPTSPDLAPKQGHSRSAYSIALPYANLPQARLVLETSGRVFQRPVQVGVERPPDRRRRDPWFDVVDKAVWSHADPNAPALPLTLSLRQVPDTKLLLTVEEGDNNPLPITRARLLLPKYQLRFYSPSSVATLQLVYGRDDIAPPRYDIALLAPQVMGGEAHQVVLGPEAGHGTAARTSFISPRLFWVLLAIAVIVLLGLIVRLMLNAET